MKEESSTQTDRNPKRIHGWNTHGVVPCRSTYVVLKRFLNLSDALRSDFVRMSIILYLIWRFNCKKHERSATGGARSTAHSDTKKVTQ